MTFNKCDFCEFEHPGSSVCETCREHDAEFGSDHYLFAPKARMTLEMEHEYKKYCVDNLEAYTITDIMTIAARNDIKIEFSFNARISAYVIRITDTTNTYCVEQMILENLYTPENVTRILKDMLRGFNEVMKRRKKYGKQR